MSESRGMFLPRPAGMYDSSEQYLKSIRNWLESATKRFILLTKYSLGTFTSILIGCLLLSCALMIESHHLMNIGFIDENLIRSDPIIILTWNIGVVFGCIFCGLNRHTWPTRKANIIVGIILLVCGTLVCFNHFIWREAIFLIAVARLMAGCCFGFIYITTLVHIADNVPKNMRGYVSTSLAIISLIPGILISILSGFPESPEIKKISHRLIGATQYIWVMMAMIIIIFCLTLIKTPEPITWYLKFANIDKARDALYRVWHGVVDPIDIENELNERVKMMADESESLNELKFLSIFGSGNWRPILLMLLLRVINVLMLNFQYSKFDQLSFNFYLKYLLALIAIKYFIDIFRIKCLLFYGVFAGVVIVLFIQWYTFLRGLENRDFFVTNSIFLIVGIEPAMHLYSSEVFPLNKRNASLALITSFQYILIGVCLTAFEMRFSRPTNGWMFFALVIIFISCIPMIWIYPETKRSSVRQCRAKFNRFYRDRKVFSHKLESP